MAWACPRAIAQCTRLRGTPPPYYYENVVTRTVRRPVSVGGVGMDPGPKHVGLANQAHARVKGSSLPYLIPLSGAIASAAPRGQVWTGGRVNLGPKPVFAHSTLPQGVGRGLFRPPQPVQKPTGDWGCLGCGWVPHAKRGGETPPRGGGGVRCGSICSGVFYPYVVSLRIFSSPV